MVVARYINGQSQDKIAIKAPALPSWNTPVPSCSPNMVKIPMQRIPI